MQINALQHLGAINVICLVKNNYGSSFILRNAAIISLTFWHMYPIPRILKEPVGCELSIFRYTVVPIRLDMPVLSISGVTTWNPFCFDIFLKKNLKGNVDNSIRSRWVMH